MAINNLDFLNSNSIRSFPILSTCSKISTDDVFTIPDDLIVDMLLSVSSDVSLRCYISKILIFNPKVIIDISNQDGIIVGSFTIDANLHNKYDVYQLTPSSAFAGANGKVVIGSLSGISTIVNGIFNFTLSTAELETRCVVPSITGINRIIFDNANGTTYSVSGDVKIEARANLRLTYDGLNNKIILDAGNGLGLNTFCEDDRTPIKTINGVAPNEDGEFFLEFEDCSEWSPIQYGIIVRDTCSQTCAGCSETEAMLNRLIQMEQNILSLRDRYNFLLSSYNEYQSNINSSCVV